MNLRTFTPEQQSLIDKLHRLIAEKQKANRENASAKPRVVTVPKPLSEGLK